MEIKVRKSPAWRATIRVPGDKSMSHRAAMLASLTNGPCFIRNYLSGEDCLGTLRVLAQLGVRIEDKGLGRWLVHGVSGKYQEPQSDLDCGNSGTTMRLMSGLLAAQPFRTRLVGDASLSRRPMKRIIEPLSRMGARLSAEGADGAPPLVVEGNPQLQGIEYALSDGPCLIRNYLSGEDCLGTLRVLGQLGVKIEERGSGSWLIHGLAGKFQEPDCDLYCGNSGTTMRLMSGLLAAQPFRSKLTGDASLSRRPMKRIVEPLSRMGARLSAEGADGAPPLVVEGNPQLQGIEYALPVPSAQVKSAVLLAGLLATGTTTVVQPVQTRDHTERMLSHFGVAVEKDGDRISVRGGDLPKPRNFDVPGDISSAAFWLVAAAAKPGCQLTIEGLGLNPTRTGVIKVLERMGGRIRTKNENTGAGEPCGSVEIAGAQLQATLIEGAEIPNVIDEIPVLAVAAALAEGTTLIKDAAELRVKESDRLAVVAHHLQAMGADVSENPDGLVIHGGRPLHGAQLESHGDHRIAMAFAIAGLFAEGETVIAGTECVETSYPGFARQIESLS